MQYSTESGAVTRSYKNANKVIEKLSAGGSHAAAIIRDTTTGLPTTSLVTWGANNNHQCGDEKAKHFPFDALAPLNVSKRYSFLAEPETVGCTNDNLLHYDHKRMLRHN